MRKEHFLEVAYTMAKRDGFGTLTRDGIAAEAGVSIGLVNHYWGKIAVLREAVMQQAVEEENLELIGQGIALGNSVAKSAPLELRTRALMTLL